MPRRFRGAPRVRAVAPGGEFELFVARSARLRFAGLMRLDAAQVRPLLFPRCHSVHTFWMRTPIDVVWLGLSPGRATVIGVEPSLAPRRKATSRRGASALELPSGAAAALGIQPGTSLTIATPPHPAETNMSHIRLRSGQTRFKRSIEADISHNRLR